MEASSLPAFQWCWSGKAGFLVPSCLFGCFFPPGGWKDTEQEQERCLAHCCWWDPISHCTRAQNDHDPKRDSGVYTSALSSLLLLLGFYLTPVHRVGPCHSMELCREKGIPGHCFVLCVGERNLKTGQDGVMVKIIKQLIAMFYNFSVKMKCYDPTSKFKFRDFIIWNFFCQNPFVSHSWVTLWAQGTCQQFAQ